MLCQSRRLTDDSARGNLTPPRKIGRCLVATGYALNATIMRTSCVSGLLGLASIVVCLPGHAHSQLRFGVSAELNRSSFGGVAPEDAAYSPNYGTGFAGILEFRVHPDVVLSFQPGWTQKGSSIVFNEDEEPDSAETFVVEQSWVTLPVYFRIDSDDRGFYAGGGMSVDLLLDSELEHEGVTADNTSAFDDVDIVYQFTAGYLHDIGSHSWFLEARYLQGITTIGNTNQSTVGDIYVADFKSNGLMLVAGFYF